MTGRLLFILGDQLTGTLSALSDIDPSRDRVLMAEVVAEATYVRHHKQKIAFVFSAMRHFAEELRDEGITVDYIRLDDAGNTQSLEGELFRALGRWQPTEVIMTEPGEYRIWRKMQDWRETLPVPLHIRDDDRFLCSRETFSRWAAGRKQYRMEHFYRQMRRATGFLMDGAAPEGGHWNFDTANRKRLPKGYRPPPRRRFSPDAITRDVLRLVTDRFAEHFGDLEPFGWAVTRAGALEALEHFVTDCLPLFGDFQDAMASGEDFLHHSIISPYLNAGLLTAREVCERSEAAYRSGQAPLNCVEGFIRQVIGWREFVRGIYWQEMPGYARSNHLAANRRLPLLYWSGDTDMNCMRQCIGATRRHAYSHHIQRLMVTGNFALLAGIAPAEIEEWYLLVYVDAYEWVELPNVHGMVMHADGGMLGSKPYAASGAYIDRMSDYCVDCAHDPAIKLGPGACPFNLLYWNFLIQNEEKLAGNPRMSMPYRSLNAMNNERRAEIVRQSAEFLESLPVGPPHVAAGDAGESF